MTSDLQSVTAFGRQMIARSKELVEQKYCIANGYPYDAKVQLVYKHTCIYRYIICTRTIKYMEHYLERKEKGKNNNLNSLEK